MAKGPLRDYVAKKMREEVGKKARRDHFPAPYALIELFEKHGDDPKAMSKGEIEAFVPLLSSETATNLRRVFFLSEGLPGTIGIAAGCFAGETGGAHDAGLTPQRLYWLENKHDWVCCPDGVEALERQ